MMEELLLWLNINNLPIHLYAQVEDICDDLEDFFSKKKELKKILSPALYKRTLEEASIEIAKREIEKIKVGDYNIITSLNKDYPKKLKYIENYPRVLYYIGDISFTIGNLLSMVGARKCTDYSKWVISHIMKDLSQYNFTIVSGLALGVDALSHEAAIKSGLKTIGVLGTGIDKEYPSKNRALYKEMKKNHLILTEFPPGTVGAQMNFPQRNRIISGLSSATCVIEAQKRSGSLITARNAFEQGREVFAVPGNINSLYSKGTNDLIADGAFPLLDALDILEGVPDYWDMKKVEKIEETQIGLSEKEEELIIIIKEKPSSIDEISQLSNKAISEISSILTMLEIKGLISEVGGKFTIN